MSKKQAGYLLITILLTVVSAASAATGKTNASAVKVVSLSPNLTEIVCQLGGRENLVGRSSACNYPDSVKKVPAVGGFATPSVEAILLKKPDFVISADLKELSIKPLLNQHGIECLILPTKTFDDYYNAVTKLGQILSKEQQAANEVKRVQKELKVFQTKNINDKNKPKVLLLVWDNPLMTVGQTSFINDLITYAGGRNIGQIEKKGYFKCSNEWLITSAPEVIICPSMKKNKVSEIKARAGWQTIPAVKDNRIYTDLDADTIFRLGPRSIDGIKTIHRCLFKNLK